MLHGACLGVRSTCTLLHEAVMGGQVVDDEDMLMHIFGFRLDIPGAKAVKAAQEALQKGIDAATEKGKEGAALLSRLKFRLCLLQILQHMHPATETSISAAANLCDSACSLLETFSSSVLPEEKLAAAPGFAPEVHRKAMGMAPPRTINIFPFDKTVEHWKITLKALGESCRWLVKCTCWRELRDQLIIFSAAPKNMPLVRSLIHRAIVSPLRAAAPVPNTSTAATVAVPGAAPKWAPSQAMIAAEFGWPCDPAPGEEAAMFLEQCAIAVQGWCHTMCLNRCRQRRRLRRLLEDWRNMTDHAFNAEASEEVQQWFNKHGWTWRPNDDEGYPLAGPVTAWVESISSWTMAAHLSLGIQLDLYAPHEFCAVYWYCDYLLGSGQAAMAEMESMRPQSAKAAAAMGGVRKGGKGKPVKKPAPVVQEGGLEERLAANSMVVKADRMMCQALMRVGLGLVWLGLVMPPPAPFNSERERFQQRFKVFDQLVRPAPLTYDDFQRSTAPGDITPPRVLLAAYEAFASAQSTIATLESTPMVRALTAQQAQHIAGVKRIAMQNLMALKLLISSISGPAAVKKPPFAVGWDFKIALQHSTTLFFPALVLKSVKKKS